LAIGGTTERAKRVLLQSCIIPYLIGALLMVLLWKL